MSLSERGLSMDTLEFLADRDPTIKNFLNRIIIKTYDDFIDCLHQDIDVLIKHWENFRHKISEDQDEDKISFLIINGLVIMGYDASHDTMTGGHVDITVIKNGFRWLGEAKIYKGNVNTWEGVAQLITRYATGREDESIGGLLLYTFQPDIKSVMNNWKDFLTEKGVAGELKDCEHSNCSLNQLAFYTTFTHPTSGLPYKIRHIPALFYFKPEDKSGKKRASKKKNLNSSSRKPKLSNTNIIGVII